MAQETGQGRRGFATFAQPSALLPCILRPVLYSLLYCNHAYPGQFCIAFCIAAVHTQASCNIQRLQRWTRVQESLSWTKLCEYTFVARPCMYALIIF
eukprot:1156613-Pelagomonas_calceolata.AAC.2